MMLEPRQFLELLEIKKAAHKQKMVDLATQFAVETVYMEAEVRKRRYRRRR